MTKSKNNLRLRVFAGPNGSGKITIINSIREYKTEHGKIDFGIHINADDINQNLLTSSFDFKDYDLKTDQNEFKLIASKSGLINNQFQLKTLETCFKFNDPLTRICNLCFQKLNYHVQQANATKLFVGIFLQFNGNLL